MLKPPIYRSQRPNRRIMHKILRVYRIVIHVGIELTPPYFAIRGCTQQFTDHIPEQRLNPHNYIHLNITAPIKGKTTPLKSLKSPTALISPHHLTLAGNHQTPMSYRIFPFAYQPIAPRTTGNQAPPGLTCDKANFDLPAPNSPPAINLLAFHGLFIRY